VRPPSSRGWSRPLARLSVRRRGPLAGIVVLLMGLLLTGATYAMLSPATAEDELAADEALVDKGRELFLVGCASCHGRNGEGILTQAGANYGPSLVGVGAASVDFQVGTGRMPLQRSGPQAEQSTVRFNAEQIAQMAAYVASLGPGPGIPSAEDVDPADGDASNGATIFRTNCAMCHNFAGKGGALTSGKYAPNLDEATEEQIYTAMLSGPQNMPAFSDRQLTPEEKQDIIAYVKSVSGERNSVGGYSLGGFGPASEAVAIFVFGLAILIGVTLWIGAKA